MNEHELISRAVVEIKKSCRKRKHKPIHCRGVCIRCYRMIHYEEHERNRRGARRYIPHPIGHRSIDKDGYARIKIGFGNGAKDWKDEHTIVMERILGRKLFSNEEVHHKNGVRSDNSDDNLELWITSQPKGQRVLDLLNHAKQIIKVYGEQLCPIDAEYF